jgi:hypothetical protein
MSALSLQIWKIPWQTNEESVRIGGRMNSSLQKSAA